MVRSHFELERAVVRCLEGLLPNYKVFRHQYLSQRLTALRALGIEGEIFQAADCVNKIRNQMAHDGKKALTAKDMRELTSQVSGAFGAMNDVLDFTVTIGSEGPKPLRDFSFREQFVAVTTMCAIAIETTPLRLTLPSNPPLSTQALG